MRHKVFAPGEIPCPICGNNAVTQVKVWLPNLEDGEELEGVGLGFAGTDGQICCSFDEGHYKTVPQAEERIANRKFTAFLNDEDRSYMVDDWEDDPCGDPYPELPEY